MASPVVPEKVQVSESPAGVIAPVSVCPEEMGPCAITVEGWMVANCAVTTATNRLARIVLIAVSRGQARVLRSRLYRWPTCAGLAGLRSASGERRDWGQRCSLPGSTAVIKVYHCYDESWRPQEGESSVPACAPTRDA